MSGTETGTQALIAAVEAGDAAAVGEMLDGDPMLVHARCADEDRHHWTALQLAAARGHLAVCRLLVERGAEVYTNPWNTYPPVMQAAWNHHQEVIDYFLKEIPEKADGTNGLGVSMVLAAREGWVELVREHIRRDPLRVHERGWIRETALHWASHNGLIEVMEALLDGGAEIEAHEVGLYGGTPLQWASEHEPAAVALLLARGANLEARNQMPDADFYGATALIVNATQRNDCAEVTELLLAAGADIHARDAAGKSALDHAREGGRARIQAVLEAHGARLHEGGDSTDGVH